MSSPFTLTIDWLAFTLPSGSAQDTMQMVGGDWTKSESGFLGYPVSWITTSASRGANWALARPVLPSKSMWLSPSGSSRRGQARGFAQSFNGF